VGIHDADVRGALHNGTAMDTWRRMIRAQGGDPDAKLPVATESHVVRAPQAGTLIKQDALPFGVAAWRLGAGRARPQDPVQHAAGIDLHVKPGDAVTAGQPLFTMNTNEPERFDRALEALEGAWAVGAPSALVDYDPLIAERID
jgi:thymidine phosphorylase